MIQKPGIGLSKLVLLAAFGKAFLALYFLLSYNNRLAADDFFYLQQVHELGIWNGMIASYDSWVTRWLSILFLNVVLQCSDLFHSLLPYHLFTIIAFVLVVMNFIRVIFARLFPEKISFATLLLYSILFTSSFFFFTFNTGETWFWVTSTAMYLWSIIFFIGGLTLIIQPPKNLAGKLVCVFCFLFIGGASESVAINVLILLLAISIHDFKKCNFSLKNFFGNEWDRILLIAIASLVAALLISYAGPGRALRQSGLPDSGIITSMVLSAKSFAKLVLFQLPLKIHWFIFFSVPWIYLGSQFASDKKESPEKIFRRLTWFISVFLLLSFISFIPASFLLGGASPFRTWIFASFYLALCCAACGFWLGYKAEWNKTWLRRAFNISLGTLFLLMTINIVDQNKITSSYAAAVDERMNLLDQLRNKGEKNTVALDALPPAGMLYSSEISEDSSYFTNTHVKKFLHLYFDIRRNDQ